MARPRYRHPLDEGFIITSPFGIRGGGMHYGLDMVHPNRMVYLWGNARILVNTEHPDYGHYIDFEVDYIDGRKIWTRYAHLASPSPLHEGSRYKVGAYAGHMGSTGSTTGDHLHMGTRMKETIAGVEQLIWTDPKLTMDTAMQAVDDEEVYVKFHEVFTGETPKDDAIQSFRSAGFPWKEEFERVKKELVGE